MATGLFFYCSHIDVRSNGKNETTLTIHQLGGIRSHNRGWGFNGLFLLSPDICNSVFPATCSFIMVKPTTYVTLFSPALYSVRHFVVIVNSLLTR